MSNLLVVARLQCNLRTAAAVDSGIKGVRVFQMDHHQSKRIFAEVKVHASVDQVWRVITDYDHLADFVPNLVTSERLPTISPGRIHLRQVGCSQSVFWRLEAEAVLECSEMHKVMGAKELRFRAIEGDFKVSAVACLLHVHGSTVSWYIVQLHAGNVLVQNHAFTLTICTCTGKLHNNHYRPYTGMLESVHPVCMPRNAGIQWLMGCRAGPFSSHNYPVEV